MSNLTTQFVGCIDKFLLSSDHVYEIHLRTLSTNAPHPKAAIPIRASVEKPTLNGGNAEQSGAVRIQVSGDLIGFLVKEALEHINGHLQIWNWETGPNSSVRHSLDCVSFVRLTSYRLFV